MSDERKYRVVQTVAVYVYAEDEEDARTNAGASTRYWDDWEMEHPTTDSKVEVAAS